MAEQKNLERAKAVFDTICRTLDNNDWRYKTDEEKLSINFGIRGDDFPIDIVMHVDAEKQLVLLMSRMPFTIREDKRVDLAVAISAVNNLLVDGCFDYDLASGNIYFRLTNTYIGCDLSETVFGYMLYAAGKMIDDYNDKFLMISKGMLTLQQFMSTLND